MEKDIELTISDLEAIAGGEYDGPIPYSEIDIRPGSWTGLKASTGWKTPAAWPHGTTGTTRRRRFSAPRAASCGRSTSEVTITPVRGLKTKEEITCQRQQNF